MEARPDQLAIGAADQGVEVAVTGIAGHPPQFDSGALVVRLGGGEQLGQILLHPGTGLLGLLLDMAEVEGVDGKPHDQRDDQQRAEQQFDVQGAADHLDGARQMKLHQLHDRLKM